MKILDLVLKKKWFDMIKDGDKREEYREIKPYWTKRLVDSNGNFKNFTHVKFRNGYTNDFIVFGIKDISIGKGKEEWGGDSNTDTYVISLNDQPLKKEMDKALNDVITKDVEKYYVEGVVYVGTIVRLFGERMRELFRDEGMKFSSNNDLNNLLIFGDDDHTKELLKLLESKNEQSV